MKRRKSLGASARPTRERTGIPHISREAVVEPVGRLVRAFHECGENGEWRKPAAHRVSTTVRDAATGKPIHVRVETRPDPDARSMAHGEHQLYVRYHDGSRHDVVVLKPNANVCTDPHHWEIELRNILTHELTHVVDPGLVKSKARAPRGDERCKYFGNRHEVTAFLAQMRDELTEFNKFMILEKLHRKGFLKKPEDLLPRSRLWAHLHPCLTPTQRKRYLRMAAQLWHEFGFDQPRLEGARRRPLGSVDWMKYADPEAWKDVRGDVHIETVQQSHDMGAGELKLHAKVGGRVVGELEAWASNDGKSLIVDKIAVGPRGHGIGTKLYEAAASWGCNTLGKPLASDQQRTAFSEGFWQKQVRKKRARCEWRLKGDEARAAREDTKYANDDHTVWARNACVRYVINRCPVRSLAGRRR